MSRSKRWRTAPVWAAAALLLCGGCGSDGPPIGRVSGTVTHGGKPVPNLTVNFMPTNGRPSWGLTDSAGRYSLHWDESHEGAEVGTHKVSVAFVPGSGGDVAPGYENAGAKKAEARQRPADQKAISEKYGDIEKTPLTREVKTGSQTIDLALD